MCDFDKRQEGVRVFVSIGKRYNMYDDMIDIVDRTMVTIATKMATNTDEIENSYFDLLPNINQQLLQFCAL